MHRICIIVASIFLQNMHLYNNRPMIFFVGNKATFSLLINLCSVKSPDIQNLIDFLLNRRLKLMKLLLLYSQDRLSDFFTLALA